MYSIMRKMKIASVFLLLIYLDQSEAGIRSMLGLSKPGSKLDSSFDRFVKAVESNDVNSLSNDETLGKYAACLQKLDMGGCQDEAVDCVVVLMSGIRESSYAKLLSKKFTLARPSLASNMIDQSYQVARTCLPELNRRWMEINAQTIGVELEPIRKDLHLIGSMFTSESKQDSLKLKDLVQNLRAATMTGLNMENNYETMVKFEHTLYELLNNKHRGNEWGGLKHKEVIKQLINETMFTPCKKFVLLVESQGQAVTSLDQTMKLARSLKLREELFNSFNKNTLDKSILTYAADMSICKILLDSSNLDDIVQGLQDLQRNARDKHSSVMAYHSLNGWVGGDF